MKTLVLGALVVLLNLPMSGAHSILRNKDGRKEEASVISDALGAMEDTFAELRKHQDEISEHIKDIVEIQDQLDLPEVTKGRENRPFRFYTDYWNGLKRNWRRRKFHIGENGNHNLHDGLTVIINIDRHRDTIISSSQNNGDIREIKTNFGPRSNDDDAKNTATTTVANIPQRSIPDSTKFLNVDSDIAMSPEGDDTNSTFPSAHRSPLTSDFQSSKLEDDKMIFDEPITELEITSTGRPVKQGNAESIPQTRQSGFLEEKSEQVTNKTPPSSHPSISSQASATPVPLPLDSTRQLSVEKSAPSIEPPLSPTQLEQSSSYTSPVVLPAPSTSTILRQVPSEIPPVTTPVIYPTVTSHVTAHVNPSTLSSVVEPTVSSLSLEVAKMLTKDTKFSELLSPSPPISDHSKGFVSVLQPGAAMSPDIKNSEFLFLIPTLPDKYSPSLTVDETIEVGAEVLSDAAKDTRSFNSFPNPLQPTRALEKGVEAGVNIISEARKDQNLYRNRSPNTLGQVSKLGNVILANAGTSSPSNSRQIPPDVPEIGAVLVTTELNQELAENTSLFSALTSASPTNMPKLVETATESKYEALSQNTESTPKMERDERFKGISSDTTSCPPISHDNSEPLNNGALSNNSVEMEIDESCPARNEIDYGKTDINTPITNNYKREEKKSINNDSNENYMAGGNNDSVNNAEQEVNCSAGRQITDKPFEKNLNTAPKMTPFNILAAFKSNADLPSNSSQAETMVAGTITNMPLPQIAAPPSIRNPIEIEPKSAETAITESKIVSVQSQPAPLFGAMSDESTKFPKVDLEVLPPKSSVISQNEVPLSFEIPRPPLNLLEKASEALKSTKLLTLWREISPPIDRAQLLLNPFEADVTTPTADPSESDDETSLPTVPIIAADEAASPVEEGVAKTESAKDIETDIKTIQLSPFETVETATVSVTSQLTEVSQLSPNALQAGAVVTGPVEVAELDDKTLSSKVPVVPPKETAPLDEIPAVSVKSHEESLTTAKSSESIQTDATVLTPTSSSNEFPVPTETPQQTLNWLEGSITMADPAESLESASETLSSTISNTLPSATSNETTTDLVIAANAASSPVEVLPTTLNLYENGLPIAEEDTEELLSTVTATSAGERTPPIEVPHQSPNTSGTDLAIADPTEDIKTFDRTLSSTIPKLQQKRLPEEVPAILPNPFEGDVAMADTIKALESFGEALSFIPPNGTPLPDGIPPLIHNSFDGVDTVESGRAVQRNSSGSLNDKKPPINVPQLSPNSLEADISIADQTTALEAATSTVSKTPSNGMPSEVKSPTVSQTTLDEDLEITESTEVFGKGTKELSTIGPVTLPRETPAKATETDAEELSASFGIPPQSGVPQLTLNPREVGVAMVRQAKFLEFDSEPSTITVTTPNGAGSPVGTTLPSQTLLEESVTTAELAKLFHTDAKLLYDAIPTPSLSTEVTQNPFESDGEALSSAGPIIPPNETDSSFWTTFLSLNPLKDGGAIPTLEKNVETVSKQPATTGPATLPREILPKTTETDAEELSAAVGIPPQNGVPRLSLSPREAGVAMVGEVEFLESDSEPSTMPGTTPNGVGSPVGTTLSSQTPLEESVTIAESAKLFDTDTKLLHDEIPIPSLSTEIPQNSFKADVLMTIPPKALESDGEALPSAIPSVPPSGTDSSFWTTFLSLNPLKDGGAIPTPEKNVEIVSKEPATTGPVTLRREILANTTETDAEELSAAVGLPPQNEVPRLLLGPREAGVAEFLESDSEPSTMPVTTPNGVGSPVGTTLPSQTPLEESLTMAGSAKLFDTDAKLLHDAIPTPSLSTEVPQNLFESDGEALSSTGPIIPPNGTDSSFWTTFLSLNPLKDGGAIPTPEKNVETVSKEPATTGPVTLPRQILANTTETDAEELSAAVGIPPQNEVPRLSLSPREADVAMVGEAEFLESDSEPFTMPVTTPNGVGSPVGTTLPSQTPLEESLTMAESAKLFDTDAKLLHDEIPFPSLSTNDPFKADVSLTSSPKAPESDGEALSSAGPIVPPNGTDSSFWAAFLSLNPFKGAGVIPTTAKDVEIVSKELASTLAPLGGILLPNDASQLSVNLFEVDVTRADTAKTLAGDELVLSTGVASPNVSQNKLESSTKSPKLAGSSLGSFVPPKYLDVSSTVEADLDLPTTSPSQSKSSAVLASSEKYSQRLVPETNSIEAVTNALESKVLTATEESSSQVVSLPPMTSETFNAVPPLSSTTGSTVSETEKLSPKSPLAVSSIPNAPWLTTPIPQKVSSPSAEAATLKQNSVGIKLSEVPAVAGAGPKLTRSTFHVQPHISEEPNDEIIEIESGDLASDWNRDMLGEPSIASAASSIVKLGFGQKDARPLYKMIDILRDMSGKKMKAAQGSRNA
nr:unnamed protein product [Callosobruchus analis]